MPWSLDPILVQFDTIYKVYDNKTILSMGIGNSRVLLFDGEKQISDIEEGYLSYPFQNDDIVSIQCSECKIRKSQPNFPKVNAGTYYLQIIYNSVFEANRLNQDIWRGKMVSNKFKVVVK